MARLNPAAIQNIANGLQSSLESVTSSFFEGLNTVFFQGASPFLGAPPNVTPNQIDAGVWTRGGSGMNTEHSVATDSLGSVPTNLTTQTHFGGAQVGSDLGVFNIQNTGWNLHGGVTGGVAQSLVATAIGLVVALFSLFAFNYFSRRLERLIDDLEVHANERLSEIRLKAESAAAMAGDMQ